jgi:tetratricopeptide (TPR) repeat protein
MTLSGDPGKAAGRVEGLMRSGSFEGAAAFAGALLAAGARSSSLLRAYAEALWGCGRLPEALRAARLAAGLRPADPAAELLLAQLLLACGRKAAARAAARAARRQWPLNAAAILAGGLQRYNLSAGVPGLLELFRSKFAALDYPGAFRLGESLLNLRAPCGNEVLSVLAAPVTGPGVLCPALESAARLRALFNADIPPELEIWRTYYLTYLASAPVLAPAGAWKKLYKKAVEKWRDLRPADLRRYGWMLKEAGRKRLFSLPPDYRGARAALAGALASPPPEADAFGRLAEAELCLGRRRAAFGWLAKGLAACPGQEGELRAWRGELKLFLGDYGGALADLRGAVRRKSFYAYTWQAIALMKTGRLDAALAAAGRAIAANPTDGEAVLVRGEIRRLKKDYAGARADLLRALDWAAPYRHALWAGLNLLLLELEAGDRRAAARVLRLAARAAGGSGPARELFRELSALSGERAALKAGVEALFARARGLRRDEAYLFPLWLGRAGGRLRI